MKYKATKSLVVSTYLLGSILRTEEESRMHLISKLYCFIEYAKTSEPPYVPFSLFIFLNSSGAVYT